MIHLQYLRLSGTYYDIGRAFGRSRRGIDQYETPGDEAIEIALKFQDLLQEHACDLHDEIMGFSQGIGLNHESVLVAQFLPSWALGCNLFFVKGEHTENGSPIFVRHMDWIEDDLRNLTMLETAPTGRNGVIGLSFAEVGCYDGINTAGLAIGTASVPFFNGTNRVGLRDKHVSRWVLDNFSSVEEAVDYMREVPHAEAINFLVADKTGASARVEVTPTRVRAKVSNDGLKVVNNFFMLEGTKDLDNMPEDDRSRLYHRRIHAWFSAVQGTIGLKHVKEVCRSHEMGICEHLKEPPGGTIYSWISELGTNTLHLSIGYPCSNRYVPFTIARPASDG